MRVLPVLAICLASPASAAPGQTEPVRLESTRERGAEECPDAETLEQNVAARLGRSPFREDAARLIRVRLEKAARGFRATITVLDGGGAVVGNREVLARRAGCAELATAVELAIAILIDPLGSEPGAGELVLPSLGPPAPPLPELVTDAPPPQAEEGEEGQGEDRAAAPLPTVSGRRPLRRSAVHPFVGVGLVAALGAEPGMSGGGTLQLGARRGSWSVALEGRGDLPGRVDLGKGSATGALRVGLAIPCVHHGRAAACALVAAGVVRGAGHELRGARSETSFFGAVGGRLFAELPAGSHLVVRLHADLLVPLQKTVLRVGGESVWTSPPVSGALGAAAVLAFP